MSPLFWTPPVFGKQAGMKPKVTSNELGLDDDKDNITLDDGVYDELDGVKATI